MANQVARFIAMASLAMVCGLLEEEVFAIQSENIAALKTLNDYFYSQMSSSSEYQLCLANVNKSLQRPETGDTPRYVLKVVLNTMINLFKWTHKCSLLIETQKCCTTGDASLPPSYATSGFV